MIPHQWSHIFAFLLSKFNYPSSLYIKSYPLIISWNSYFIQIPCHPDYLFVPFRISLFSFQYIFYLLHQYSSILFNFSPTTYSLLCIFFIVSYYAFGYIKRAIRYKKQCQLISVSTERQQFSLNFFTTLSFSCFIFKFLQFWFSIPGFPLLMVLFCNSLCMHDSTEYQL